MSGVTDNYGLILPADGEAYDVNITNQNNIAIDTQLKTLSKTDKIMQFVNTAFAWGGSSADWDAGALSADTSTGNTSQVSASALSFVSPSTTSGNLKFNEPGIYVASWLITPSADPGNSGYRIAATGVWPGPFGAFENIFGQTQKSAGTQFFESFVVSKPFRVPQAGLELRFFGRQANGTTNGAKITVTQLGKF